MKMSVDKATNILKKLIVFLIYIEIQFEVVQSTDCPALDCSDKKPLPQTKNGIVTLTVYYDNDSLDNNDQKNAGMIQSVCRVHDAFPKNFEVKFVVGASASKDDKGNLQCYGDCGQDRLEVCVIAKIKDATKFMKCNNNGGDVETCVDEQDTALYDAIDKCAQGNESIDLLLKNSQAAKDVGVVCYLPDYAFNDVYDRCATKDNQNDDDIAKHICDIMKDDSIETPDKCDELNKS